MAKIILILALALFAFTSMIAASPLRLDKLPRDRWPGKAVEKRAVSDGVKNGITAKAMVEIITKNTGLSEPLTNNAENLNMERAEASADHVKDIFWERGLFRPKKAKAAAPEAEAASAPAADTQDEDELSDDGTNQDWGRSHAWRNKE